MLWVFAFHSPVTFWNKGLDSWVSGWGLGKRWCIYIIPLKMHFHWAGLRQCSCGGSTPGLQEPTIFTSLPLCFLANFLLQPMVQAVGHPSLYHIPSLSTLSSLQQKAFKLSLGSEHWNVHYVIPWGTQLLSHSISSDSTEDSQAPFQVSFCNW